MSTHGGCFFCGDKRSLVGTAFVGKYTLCPNCEICHKVVPKNFCKIVKTEEVNMAEKGAVKTASNNTSNNKGRKTAAKKPKWAMRVRKQNG